MPDRVQPDPARVPVPATGDSVTRRGGTRIQPNDRTQRTAAKLLGIGPEITAVIVVIRDELSTLGFAGSSGDGGMSGSGISSPVERDAVRVHQLTAGREDLRDAITDISERVDALVRLVKHLSGQPLPGADGEVLCCDRQMGREGSTFGWGDPTCTDLGVAGGLCYRCYQAERRWRAAHGLPDRAEA